MSSTNKSSKDILNELFSSFNTSYDEEAAEEAEESNKGGSKKRKKSKKAKKSKKKDKKGNDSDDNSSGGGDDEDEKKLEEPSHKKTHHHKHRHGKDKQNGESESQHKDGKKVSKKHRRTEEEGQGAVDGDDVDTLIQKHRHKVKRQFKGLVSNIGDIVINNDELIKSKSKKREDDIRRASGQQPLQDMEDGEILEDTDDFFGKKHHKSKKLKISASQAYKLDMEEKMLLGIEPPVASHKKAPKEDGHEVKRSKHSSSSDKRHDNLEWSSTSRDGSSSHKRRKSGDNTSESSSSRVVRQAPARTPTPPPPEDFHVSSSSRRSSSYNYKDTKWQKEQNHYESQQSYSRRSERDYDAGNYYEKETTRRSDGRGFGFDERSYYDNPVNHGDRRHGHYQHDERGRRERSRSPRDSRRRSRSPPRWRRSRSRSSERRRRHPDDIIDKAKLLEIARKNAAKLMRRGVLPSDIFSRDQIMAIRAGGKSVEELTDYCKRIAKRDANGVAISDDDSGDDGDADHFLHHPFQVKDRPLPQITLNIRNAVPIPIRTPQVLAIESAKLKVTFPVSSGTQHRIKELEWHPVDKDEEEKKKAAEAASTSLVPLDGPKVNAVSPMVRDQTGGEETVTTVALLNSTEKPEKEKKASPPPQHSISLEQPQVPNFDISDVIAIRLKAMRQLSENPKSDDAKKQLEDATQMMKKWADSKALEPKFLTQSELTQGPQAWAKRDQLVKAKEVQSPMGLHLLQKMGWRPGDGLGKTKSGDIQPLALEVKTDKKGLTSVLDLKKGPAMPLVYDLSGKHPISALMELCAKRKWGAPDFDLVFEHGPAHKKQFVYKVVVNGVEYQPCVAVNNKKMAKTNAAAFCLQSLGLLPTATPATSSETLQTVAPEPVPPPPPLAAGFNNNNTGLPRFTPAHYLQTVPSTPTHQLPLYPQQQQQPPLPPELLMPPPPPPPLTK